MSKIRDNLGDDCMREFSRVEAYIPLSIRILSEKEKEKVKARLSYDINLLLSKPSEEPSDGALAEWLKVLNQKLDFLINIITMEQKGFSNLPFHKVDISGGGMSFISECPYELGDFLELKMVLETPSPLALFLYGEVIYSEAIADGYKIGVKFINIEEEVRDQIVKFVFYRERQILREKRSL